MRITERRLRQLIRSVILEGHPLHVDDPFINPHPGEPPTREEYWADPHLWDEILAREAEEEAEKQHKGTAKRQWDKRDLEAMKQARDGRGVSSLSDNMYTDHDLVTPHTYKELFNFVEEFRRGSLQDKEDFSAEDLKKYFSADGALYNAFNHKFKLDVSPNVRVTSDDLYRFIRSKSEGLGYVD